MRGLWLCLGVVISLIGFAGLIVSGVTEDRWLGISDRWWHYSDDGGFERQHLWAMHDGIYFEIDADDQWVNETNFKPLHGRVIDQGIHQRGGIIPMHAALPTYSRNAELRSRAIGAIQTHTRIDEFFAPIDRLRPTSFPSAAPSTSCLSARPID